MVTVCEAHWRGRLLWCIAKDLDPPRKTSPLYHVYAAEELGEVLHFSHGSFDTLDPAKIKVEDVARRLEKLMHNLWFRKKAANALPK